MNFAAMLDGGLSAFKGAALACRAALRCVWAGERIETAIERASKQRHQQQWGPAIGLTGTWLNSCRLLDTVCKALPESRAVQNGNVRIACRPLPLLCRHAAFRGRAVFQLCVKPQPLISNDAICGGAHATCGDGDAYGAKPTDDASSGNNAVCGATRGGGDGGGP
jgi:hypothetical protein